MSRPNSSNQPYRVAFSYKMLLPKYWLSWLAVGLMLILACLPHSVRYFMAAGLTKVLKPFCKKPFRIARANLGACFPDMTEKQIWAILENMMFNFSLVGLSMGTLAIKSCKHLEEHITINGLEHVERAREQGKPIVFLVPHVWGIEYAGARLSSWGLPMMGMIKDHKNPVFNWLSVRQRCRFGGTVYHRNAGLRALIQGLRRGESLFYLPDQDHGPEKSVFADFFATKKATLPVIGRLSNLGGAVVLPLTIGVCKWKGHMTMDIFAPLEIGSSISKEQEAKLLNQQLEKLIGMHPEQYMWFLKVLHTRPEGFKILYR